MTRIPRTTIAALVLLAAGCAEKAVPYGRESINYAPRYGPRSIAVAPAVNLSGQSQPDPLLQADLVYQELQQVRGITAVPVNRVVQVMAGLGLRSIDSTEAAWAICDAVGVDALLLPSITAFDPYDPPKFGGSVQLFVRKATTREGKLDPRMLSRRATGGEVQPGPVNADFIQVAAMFDAAAGSTRDRVDAYAVGRVDPTGALGTKEFYLNMDRYAAFAWHALIEDALSRFED
jgi:hypothetical protein